MQRTRLNTLTDTIGGRIEALFSNPWRRIALSLICLLLGNFMGAAIVTTSGQDAAWDVSSAALLILFTEIAIRFVYTRRRVNSRSLFVSCLNLFRVGLTYSLFLEAFKLGS